MKTSVTIENVKVICFSPTGTTKKIAKAIAKGIKFKRTEIIDISKPEARKSTPRISNKDLLIVAIPVYMGRLPSFVKEWLQTIEGCNTPAVCIVMYGNRAFDNALLELRDTLKNRGCIPFAGAAFVGEHSFSSDEYPSSVGRPDHEDINKAELFGNSIFKKLSSIISHDDLSDVKVPGIFPYGGTTELWKVDFIGVNDNCHHCGICAENCPTGAINFKNSSQIDIQKCILCCACIKNCLHKAKSMKPGLMKEAAVRCSNFITRKEPEIFLT